MPSWREHLDVQAERLHLLDEHLERLGDAGLGDVLALDDRLVDLDAAEDVVGLDREQLLQRVGGAVRLQRPDLHLTEALATELGLTAQRLLRDHRVRAGRARVDLVVDQVVQLEDVHVADRDRVRERLAGAAVEQARLAVLVDHAHAVAVGERRAEQTGDLVLAGAVEHRGRDLGVRLGLVGVDLDQPLLPARRQSRALGRSRSQPCLASQPEVELEDLAEVHAARARRAGSGSTSTGVPSSMNGMSSTGRIFAMTPLLPWRPASLSPRRSCASGRRRRAPAG